MSSCCAQDMIFSSQEQLQVTVGASVAEARAQLLSLQTQLRTQLYASYLEQCMQVSPEFRERGRRCAAVGYATTQLPAGSCHAHACTPGTCCKGLSALCCVDVYMTFALPAGLGTG